MTKQLESPEVAVGRKEPAPEISAEEQGTEDVRRDIRMF
jgi:hypothetical protein